MTKQDQKILLIILAWLLINLFTASNTELLADEAYYWVYGNKLAWGYFDHPPLIAIYNYLIDRYIYHSELSVRLLSVLSSCVYIWVLYKIVNPQNMLLFVSLVFSSIAMHLFGFVSVPDVPLLLFSVIFYWVYIQYIQAESWKNVLLLCIVIPLLFYSKYHALLIVFFSLLAYPKVFLRKSFYLILFASLLLYVPHILWQIENNYPSIKYHLIERNSPDYSLKYTLDYIGGQLIFYSPVAIVLAGIALVKTKADFKHKLMKYNYLGFVLFFLFSSLKGYVEVNWTLPIITGITLLAYEWTSTQSDKFTQKISYLNIGFILLFLAFRIELIHPSIDSKVLERVEEFHNHKTFAVKIKKISKNKQVCAIRYQEAALLTYYMGQWVPSINIGGRKNIYNSWHEMKKINGKPSFLLSNKPSGIELKKNKYLNLHLQYFNQLSAFEGLMIDSVSIQKDRLVLFCNPKWIQEIIKSQHFSKQYLVIDVDKEGKSFSNIFFAINQKNINTQTGIIVVNLKNKLSKGKYTLLFNQYDGLLNDNWSNSLIKKISIE